LSSNAPSARPNAQPRPRERIAAVGEHKKQQLWFRVRVLRRMRPLVRLACISLAFISVSAASQSLDFTGSVRNGETFRKSIGHGLVFVLAPDSAGYNISIEPAGGVTRRGKVNDNDFSNCVTPPYHGPNPRMLFARDFQGKNLSTDRLTGVKNREFSFVLNSADQKKACAELSEALYGPEKKDQKGNPVLGFLNYQEPPLGHGVFDLLTFELGDRQDPDRFTSMTFAVHIEFPTTPRKQ
jgi:hypothetical protein